MAIIRAIWVSHREKQNMPKTISVSEAKNKLSAMLKWAVENQDEVVVESRGRPKAVILPYAEYEMFQLLREKERRQVALQRLQELAAANQALNQDLTPEEAEEIADEVTRETIERMAAEDKVTFAQS
jgi:prevent-host-death family protein